MSFLAVLLLSFAMSTDAFAIAVCKGVSMPVSRFFDAFKIGLLFGVVETLTPILGWCLGYVALPYIEKWDHWVILILMSFLGGRMILNSLKKQDGCEIDELPNGNKSIFVLILVAISTSIDAFVVGAGLAFASVNILMASAMIGIVTCMMVTIGILLGKQIGVFVGKKAEFLGGIVLISIGLIALYQHLSA